MSTYATADDVAARWGKSTDDMDAEIIALINVRLGDAERMIRRRFKRLKRDLDADVTSGVLDPEDVKQVEADAVLRLARNPEGYFSETDGTYTYQFQQSLSTGTLEILPEEWDILGLTITGLSVIVPTAVVAS
ncbi:MAG: Gp19/Gp15/Gp42 family protein [Isosphaeraceae bacterium]